MVQEWYKTGLADTKCFLLYAHCGKLLCLIWFPSINGKKFSWTLKKHVLKSSRLMAYLINLWLVSLVIWLFFSNISKTLKLSEQQEGKKRWKYQNCRCLDLLGCYREKKALLIWQGSAWAKHSTSAGLCLSVELPLLHYFPSLKLAYTELAQVSWLGMVELHKEISKNSHTAFPAWNSFSHLSFKPASCVD